MTSQHPLLQKRVLSTLVCHLTPRVLYSFRLVCKDMYNESLSKFRRNQIIVVDIDSTYFHGSYIHQWQNQNETMQKFCNFEEYPYPNVVLNGVGRLFGYRPEEAFWKSPLAIGIKHLHLRNIDMRTTLDYFLDIIYKHTPNLECVLLERNRWYLSDQMAWASRDDNKIPGVKMLKRFAVIGVDLKGKNKPLKMHVPWHKLLVHFPNLEDLGVFGVTKNFDRTHEIFISVVEAFEQAAAEGCSISVKNLRFGHSCLFPKDSNPRHLKCMNLLEQFYRIKFPSVWVTMDFDCNRGHVKKGDYEVIGFDNRFILMQKLLLWSQIYTTCKYLNSSERLAQQKRKIKKLKKLEVNQVEK